MIKFLVTFLLIIGLNIPIFLEMYKHILRHKSILFQIIITMVYWTVAFMTQTLGALTAIIYLYVIFYRKTEPEETLREINIWHIDASDVVLVSIISIFARIFIIAVNFVYVIVLDKLFNYEIKPQEVVTYYTGAELWLKGILAIEIVLIAPMIEEFVFRFFLYDKLLVNKMPRYMAAIISAAVFALVHFNVAGIPTFFGLGLFCAYMYEKKGYWGAVIAHGISNAFTLLFL